MGWWHCAVVFVENCFWFRISGRLAKAFWIRFYVFCLLDTCFACRRRLVYSTDQLDESYPSHLKHSPRYSCDHMPLSALTQIAKKVPWSILNPASAKTGAQTLSFAKSMLEAEGFSDIVGYIMKAQAEVNHGTRSMISLL